MQNSKLKKVVFLNGKFLTIKEAKISVLEPGFLYGWGLFETMRSYNNRIVYFNCHLKRIKKSCNLIKMQCPYSIDKLKWIIKKTVEINGFKDAYVRLTLWKKSETLTNVLVIARKYKPFSAKKYRQGFSAGICRFRQNENSFFSRLKTTNYLLYQLAYLEAKNKGFDEAIILNNRGYIAQGSRSNIFLVKDNQLFTPHLDCGCLDGVTRRVILDMAKKYKIKAGEANFTLQDLYAADEIFLTNSLTGVMPLASIEKKAVGRDKRGKLTKFFIKKYNLLLKNGT